MPPWLTLQVDDRDEGWVLMTGTMAWSPGMKPGRPDALLRNRLPRGAGPAKVSEGWVRCGRCNEVFNALEGLFDLERDSPPEWSESRQFTPVRHPRPTNTKKRPP